MRVAVPRVSDRFLLGEEISLFQIFPVQNKRMTLLPAARDWAFAYDRFFETNKLWAKQRWMGVQTQQNPNDAWIIQEILWDTQPDLLIETGTQNGGSALFYASIMRQYNPHAKVLTIDKTDVNDYKPLYSIKGHCDRVGCRNATDDPIWKQHVTFLKGDSAAHDVIDRLNDFTARSVSTMVILDSLHSYSHVLKELELYSEAVSIGAYLVVQDTKLDRLRGRAGPQAAVSTWLNATRERRHDLRFEVDTSREYLLYTQHAGGYLKRVA